MDLGWTNGFFEGMQGGHRSQVHGFSLHFYTDFRNNKMRVADFKAPDWYAVLLEGLRTEAVIEAHWKAMGKYDPQRRTKLVIDEWGVWYQPGEEITPDYILSQPVTLRDALHTAITFDIFNRHADKIEMANVAQTVNCIHSLFLAHEDKYTRTPPYYVFEMYRPHMGARLAPMQVRGDELTVPAARRRGENAGADGFRFDPREALDGHAHQPVSGFAGHRPHPIRGRRAGQRWTRRGAHAQRYARQEYFPKYQ